MSRPLEDQTIQNRTFKMSSFQMFPVFEGSDFGSLLYFQILCLHGYRQNEVMFRDKLGAFRKMIGKSADFKFITAPHQVPPLEDADADNQNQVWVLENIHRQV